MPSHNEITGDALVSKTNNDNYRNNYDAIFGKKTKETQDDGDRNLDQAKDLPEQEAS